MGMKSRGGELGGAAETWGVLGGTFDPIHYAHLAIAEQTREALGLTKVLFVPARVPPHKLDRAVSAPEHRMAMVALATADNAAFEASAIELMRPGPSFTVDTIAELSSAANADGSREVVLIISVEALAGLPTWREPQRLLAMCRIAVVPRRGHPRATPDWIARHFPGQEDRIVFLDGPDLGHSASEVRERAASRRSIRYLVPPPVEAYIEEHALYRSHAGDPEPVSHSARCPVASGYRRRARG